MYDQRHYGTDGKEKKHKNNTVKDAKRKWINEMCDEIEELDNLPDTLIIDAHSNRNTVSIINGIPILTDTQEE